MIRVTEVLNYFKEPWYIDWVHKVGRTEANKISKAAMKLGTNIDGIIKASPHALPIPIKLTTEENNCLLAYAKWYEVYKPKSITPCSRLYATIEGVEVTGEPDIMVDDVLVDIKCSSKIDLKYWIQVNMYLRLPHWPMHPLLNKSKVGILRLDKVTASYEYVVQDYSPSLVDVWVGLMRAYVLFNKEACDGVDIREETSKQEVA